MKTKHKSARNKQYWIEKGYAEPEAIKMARSRMPGTAEYFLYFKKTATTDAEAQQMMDNWGKNRANTLENLSRKYGADEGASRYKIYCDKQAYSNTLEYMIKKYGVEKGTEKYYSANKNRAITIENCNKKHGEVEGKVIWEGYVKKQRVNGKTKEYFIEKYGETDGIAVYNDVGKRKSQTFSGYLLRENGDVESATKKFNAFAKKRGENAIKNRGVSKSSQEIFNALRDDLLDLGYEDFYYADHNCEWGINIVNKNRYAYLDFFLKDTGKVIEYNGDYFHANPLIHKPTDIIHIYGVPTLASTVWENDANRIADIKTIPYIKDVLTIWEGECNLDPETVIARCIKFLIE